MLTRNQTKYSIVVFKPFLWTIFYELTRKIDSSSHVVLGALAA